MAIELVAPAAEGSIDEVIGEKVAHLMWKQRITQTSLATRVGMKQSVLGRKLRGMVTWSARDVYAVASVLRVEVGELYRPLSAGYGESPRPTGDEGSAVGVRPKGFEPPTF